MDLIYETDRLILRVLKASDAPAVLDFQLRNKDLFERYEPARPENFYTIEHQKILLNCEYNLTVKLSAVRFYVFLKEQPDIIIGTICFRNMLHSIYSSCETGYKFDEQYHRRGYAFEAMTEGIRIVFDELKLHRIAANVMPENHASIRLLESLGFEQEGVVRDYARIQNEWADHIRYSLIHR